jgi:hypothetical protein
MPAALTGEVTTAPAVILRAARARIEREEHWTKGAFARVDPNDLRTISAIGPRDPQAVCWCAAGAIRAVAPAHDGWDKAEVFLERAIDPTLRIGVGQFNDNASHGMVLAAFDRAIALAEAQS